MMKQLIMLFVMLAAMMVAGEYEIAWKQDEGTSRIVSIELNGEHLAKLGGHPEWLRLHDCNGAIVPWARQQRTAAVYGEKRVDVPLQLDEVRHGDGGRCVHDAGILGERVHPMLRPGICEPAGRRHPRHDI